MLLLDQDLCFSPVPKFFLCGKIKVNTKKKWNEYGQNISELIIFSVDTSYNRDHFAVLKIKPNRMLLRHPKLHQKMMVLPY